VRAYDPLTRRSFLGGGVAGIGAIAARELMSRAGATDRTGRYDGAVSPRHHAPRVKRVIHLYMAGGPSHLETLDHKPKLRELHGQPMPESFTRGQPIAQLQGQR